MKLIQVVFLCLLTLIWVLPATAEAPVLKGSYVMEEEGFTPNGPLAALASLTFAENGAVTGVQLIETASGLQRSDVQGVYSFNNGLTGTLTLSIAATDEEGNAVNIVQNYRLVVAANKEVSAIRSNMGFYSVARLCPSVQNGWNGMYLFTEVSTERDTARIACLNLDAAGNATGFQLVQELGVESTMDVKGTYKLGPDGFATLELSTEKTNADGDTVKVIEQYMFVVNQDGIKMMRSDTAVIDILTMSK